MGWAIFPRHPSTRCCQKRAQKHVDRSDTADERSTTMKYRLLGKSGLRVSEASLGTMTFGDEWGWGSPKPEAEKVYETYREAGGNFIYTANFYTGGTSERFVGEFIQGHRESVVLATKYSNAAPGNDPNAAGNHRKSMMQALEASLKRLQTNYIDLYWVYMWDGITPVEEVMRGLDDIVSQGKVLYVGISDAPAWWIAQANTLAELRGWTQFIGLQIEYSLIERTVERELIPMAKAESSSDSPRVFTREKWSVQLGTAARGIACCSKCGEIWLLGRQSHGE